MSKQSSSMIKELRYVATNTQRNMLLHNHTLFFLCCLVQPTLITSIKPPIWIHEQAIIIFRVIDIQPGSTVAAVTALQQSKEVSLLDQSPFYLLFSHSFFLPPSLAAVKMEESLSAYLFVLSSLAALHPQSLSFRFAQICKVHGGATC